MAKWYGEVGYAETVEIKPGIWKEQIVKKTYSGEVISNRWKRQNSGEVNNDINIYNQISIVADPYANENCSKMAYVEFMGSKWQVTDVEVQFPRLILSIGGVYNEPQT